MSDFEITAVAEEVYEGMDRADRAEALDRSIYHLTDDFVDYNESELRGAWRDGYELRANVEEYFVEANFDEEEVEKGVEAFVEYFDL
jgi:hypothetical protein